MISKIRSLYKKMHCLMREEGQDMVEYALVVALIAFAATAGEKSLATKINTAFTDLATQVATNIT